MKTTKLQANVSNGKFFTSADHLNELATNKVINREIVAERHGLHWSEFTYRFSTHTGLVLADVKRYSDHGFCSQAYGVEIATDSLTPAKRINSEYEVWLRDMKLFRKHKVIAKIAIKERGIEAFY